MEVDKQYNSIRFAKDHLLNYSNGPISPDLELGNIFKPKNSNQMLPQLRTFQNKTTITNKVKLP